MEQAIECVDLFDGIAPLLRARPIIDDVCRFGGDWTVPIGDAPAGDALFHIVMRGSCVLEQIGQGPVTIREGDILCLPRGPAHVIRSLSGGKGNEGEICEVFPNAIRTKTLSDGADTELICGRLQFEAPDNPLLAILPDLMLSHTSGGTVGRMGMLLAAIRDELDDGRVGGALIATELANVLFLMLLRLHIEESPPLGGLVALLAEPTTARVVSLLMKDLSRVWTLEGLAREAGTSRATLVRAFRRLSGQTPLAFASDLRLHHARARLLRTKDTIASIAAQVGYQSEQGLSRAMLRRLGVRPGRLRMAANTPDEKSGTDEASH